MTKGVVQIQGHLFANILNYRNKNISQLPEKKKKEYTKSCLVLLFKPNISYLSQTIISLKAWSRPVFIKQCIASIGTE